MSILIHHFVCIESTTAKKVCGKLPHPDYGKVYVKDYSATYKCDYGYKLVGDYRRVCKNGYWLGDAPYCVKTYKH